LAKNEKAAANVRPTAPDAQSQDVIRDPAGDKAERDGRTQQLPPDAQALIADPLQGDSEKVDKDRRTQERLAQSQHGPEQLQSQRQRKLEAIQRWQISGAAVSRAGEVPSSPPSPTAELLRQLLRLRLRKLEVLITRSAKTGWRILRVAMTKSRATQMPGAVLSLCFAARPQ